MSQGNYMPNKNALSETVQKLSGQGHFSMLHAKVKVTGQIVLFMSEKILSLETYKYDGSI